MRTRFLCPVTVALFSATPFIALITPLGAKDLVATRELSPFTHTARVAAGADIGTIRFQCIKRVQVPTRVRYTADSAHCDELQFREPGGSAACPQAKTEASETAYEVTYSVKSQPMASDESASREFTFSVYFRPGELPADVHKAIARKLSHTDLAGYFAVTTSVETAPRTAIDNEKSHFCAGNYVDGAWTHADRACLDDIRYGKAASSSGFLTVRVEPVSRRVNVAAAGGK
jgi:hypothetical protein